MAYKYRLIANTIFVLTILSIIASANAGQLYERKDSWQETMIQIRSSFGQLLAEQLADGGQVKLGPWYATDPITVSSLSDPKFPETSIDLTAKQKGKSLWHERPEWTDGKVYSLPDNNPAATYLYRTISVGKDLKCSAGFGSNDGLAVWLNGQRVLFRDVGRKAEPEQDKLLLELHKGENQLLMKVYNRASGSGFYFSLQADPAFQIFKLVEKDFPTESAWMLRDLGLKGCLEFIRSGKSNDLHKNMISRVLEQSEPVSDKLKSKFNSIQAETQSQDREKKFLDLYVRTCKLRDTMERLKGIDFDTLRMAIKQLKRIAAQGDSINSDYLEHMESCEKRVPEIINTLANGDGIGQQQADELKLFAENIFTILSDFYKQQCPPIAFVKRHHFKKPFGIGTLLAWDVFSPGGGIYIYDPANPQEQAKEIFNRDDGVIFSMSASYDAKKLLFSWRKCSKEDSFHIYQINIDGTGLKQITTGRYHDVDPVYLPDGRICFVSTRVEAYQMCQPAPSCALFVMNPDGSDIHRIEFGTLSDHSPYVLDDGSILFMRWEYQDKGLFTSQGLWTINPNGNHVSLFYGNTISVPNVIWQAKTIPDTDRVLCTLAPHHGNPVGAIGIVDRSKGLENPESILNLTPEIPYKPTVNPNWGPGDKKFYWSYRDPYPINRNLFLVAYGGPLSGGPERYRLYFLDDNGFKVQLYEDKKISCFNPVPLVKREIPHLIPTETETHQNYGTFFVSDVYRGLEGVERGSVKQLRIMSTVSKRCNMRGKRAYDHDPLISVGTYYVKQCWGTVPVSEDGSAYFKAPAEVELYFQALDEQGREIRRMGTVTQLMPGETQSCVGCHESRFMAAPNKNKAMQILSKGPVDITPPTWGAGPVDYARQVQPVLDKYCIKCHSGIDPKAAIDLSGDKTKYFNMSYDNLTERKLVDFYWLNQGPTNNFLTNKSGSRVSKLDELIQKKHGKVDMDPESRRRIYTWIEANVPYYATYDQTRPGTSGSRDAWQGSWKNDFDKMYSQKCGACHGAPKTTWVNLTNPSYSRVLNAPLAKSAGGLELCKQKDDKLPVLFDDRADPGYIAMFQAICRGKEDLDSKPRMDMANAEPIPYPQDFGGLYDSFAGP